MMEIYGTIHFKLILPHIPGFPAGAAAGACLQPLAGLQGLPLSPPRFSLLGRGRDLPAEPNE